MARPKKDSSERRTERLNLRLTPAERLRLERAAAQAGLPASEYARMLALKGRVVVKQHRAIAPALFEELRRIGVNLNQLAYHANIGRYREDEVFRACAAVEELLARELGHGP